MAVGDELIEGLALAAPEHVALVGGGGKTTLMWALVEAGQRRGWRSVAGTTTRVGAWQVDRPEAFLHSHRVGDKLVGLPPARVDEVWQAGDVDLLAIEADGSRGKGVKAPRPDEPVVASTCTFLLAVLGADTLDRVIEDVAHRPLRVAAVCGCSPYERLTVDRAARLLASPHGGQRARPDGARFGVALTRIRPGREGPAEQLADRLASQGIPVVLFAWR